jgi:hypothetical protein
MTLHCVFVIILTEKDLFPYCESAPTFCYSSEYFHWSLHGYVPRQFAFEYKFWMGEFFSCLGVSFGHKWHPWKDVIGVVILSSLEEGTSIVSVLIRLTRGGAWWGRNLIETNWFDHKPEPIIREHITSLPGGFQRRSGLVRLKKLRKWSDVFANNNNHKNRSMTISLNLLKAYTDVKLGMKLRSSCCPTSPTFAGWRAAIKMSIRVRGCSPSLSVG